MPNHVSHVVRVTGPQHDVQRFFTMHFDCGGDAFDFDKIIPQPDIISQTESSTVAENGAALILMSSANPFSPVTGLREAQWERISQEVDLPGARPPEIAKAYLDMNPDYREKGAIRLKAAAETGYTDWYRWNIDHWGTKWGSYEVEFEEPEGGVFEFLFQSAWSPPLPVFEALVKLYPSLTFDIKCFDEGWNFAGEGQMGAHVQEPFATTEATDELYEAVYGFAPEHDEDD